MSGPTDPARGSQKADELEHASRAPVLVGREAPVREVKNAAVDRCVELVQAWDERGAPRFELSELVTAMRAVGAGEGEGR